MTIPIRMTIDIKTETCKGGNDKTNKDDYSKIKIKH